MLKPILLVEDNPNDLELTLIALAKSQLANEVVVVRDGAEALDYLHRRGEFAERTVGNPAVILLDLKLPKRSGLEVLRWVRSQQALDTTPVVVLTSSGEDEDIQKAYALGANSYLQKPVAFNGLVQLLGVLDLYWFRNNLSLPPAAASASVRQ